MTICSPRYTCEGCGRKAAGGGQRFCWACLVDVFCGQDLGTSAKRAAAQRRAQHAEVVEAHRSALKGGASMIEIVNANGQVLHRSRNLRGIFAHGRRTWIEEAVACPAQAGKGLLSVTFGDGATCQTEFAGYETLCRWLRSRRSWAGVRRINGAERF
jgi:hypothetical protein